MEQLSEGVGWALGHLRNGEAVLVQCTLGHGRSATFAAAMLLATGAVDTVDDAVQRMRSMRQHVGLNRPQRASLDRALEAGAITVASFSLDEEGLDEEGLGGGGPDGKGSGGEGIQP